MSIINKYDLAPGDRLIVPKRGLYVVNHHAIVLSNHLLRENYIIENSLESGVQIIGERTFFEGIKSIKSIERFIGSEAERRKQIKHAINLIGKKYDLLKYNCEHFANDVQKKRIVSKQVKNGLLLILILACIIPLLYKILKK